MPQPPPGMPDLDRLDFYRAHKAQEAREEEAERVTLALLKEPPERTDADNAVIAYSPLGTGQRCGCG